MAKSTVRAESVRIRVAALSTSNLTPSGAQTVDSVACVAGDLVGALGQSNGKNGVYVVQSGAWLAADPGFGTGLEVYAKAGGNANKVYGCDTTGAIDWGTDSTTFTLKESSGAAFDPASPGTIGGTDPGVVNADVLAIDGGTTPAAAAGFVKHWANADASIAAVNHGVLGLFTHQNLSTAAGAHTQFAAGTVSLADDASLDIAIGAGGHGTVTAVGASSSSSGSFSFANDGSTTTNGLTYTNFATADTDTKLCAFSGGAATLRIRNRLGSTQKILITIWEGIAAS